MVKLTVRDIMTKKVISVNPGESLVAVVNLLFRYNFDGLPVVDEENHLLGIITQYDLVAKSSGLHLPTLAKIFENIPVLKQDLGPLKKSFENINRLTARDLMNPDPLTIGPDELAEVGAKLFVAHHRVNPIPVIDKERRAVGVLSRRDIIELFDPEHFAAALGEVLETGDEHPQRKIDGELSETLAAVRKNLLLVSRWRSVLLYVLLAVFLFLAGVAAISLLGPLF